MKKRQFIKGKEYIDSKTGEIVSSVINIPVKTDDDFFKCYQLGLARILDNLRDGLLIGAFHTLYCILEKMRINNPDICIQPQEIVDRSGLSRAQVQNHIKLLIKFNIIEQVIPRQNIYRINKVFFCMGQKKEGKK